MLTLNQKPVVKKDKCVVRLRTTAYSNKKGVYLTKNLTYLKRKCVGFNILEEDVYDLPTTELIEHIVNFNTTGDGVYEVVMCNIITCWETGAMDGWDYMLVPYKEDKGE